MRKNFLPLSVYTVWLAAALGQAAINLYHAATTLPEYRLTHVVAILVHLGLAGFFLSQRRKAQDFVAPIAETSGDALSERSARAMFWGSVAFAALFEAFAVWMTVDYLRINARYDIPLTLGGALSQLGMHLLFASTSYGIVAVSRKAWQDARQPVETTAVEATEETAPLTGWWTQDETRQEIRRR